MYAVQQEVRSVEGALVVIGEDAFRRVATLAITSDLNAGQNQEVLRLALVRGRFLRAGSQSLRLGIPQSSTGGYAEPAACHAADSDGRADAVAALREEIRQALNDAEARCAACSRG